jgi:hypothetical protein
MLAQLLLDSTPNTVNYMVAGFVFLLGLPILYILSFFVRRRSLERDLKLIESLKADELKRGTNPPSAAPRPSEPNAHQLP